MLADPPKGQSKESLSASLQSRMKELQIFRGPGALVLLAWEDLQSVLELEAIQNGKSISALEKIDASPVGVSAIMLSKDDQSSCTFKAFLKSPARKQPLKLIRHDILFDGRTFQIKVKPVTLPASSSALEI